MTDHDACMWLPTKWADRNTLLYELLPRKSVGAELGVYCGRFSSAIITAVAPERLVLVDAWNHTVYGARDWELTSMTQGSILAGLKKTLGSICNAILDGHVSSLNYFVQHVSEPPQDYMLATPNDRRVDVLRYLTADAACLFPDDYFDWIYVDANHSYDSVLQDLRLYAPKLRITGYMMCHDFFPVRGFRVDAAASQFLKERIDFQAIGKSGESDYPTAVFQRQ